MSLSDIDWFDEDKEGGCEVYESRFVSVRERLEEISLRLIPLGKLAPLAITVPETA